MRVVTRYIMRADVAVVMTTIPDMFPHTENVYTLAAHTWSCRVSPFIHTPQSHDTHVGCLPDVRLFVSIQVPVARKPRPAHVARERLLPRVRLRVHVQIAPLRESRAARVTDVRLLSRVRANVRLQVSALDEPSRADVALVRALTRV